MSMSLYETAAVQARPFLLELARERLRGEVSEESFRHEADVILDEALDQSYRIEEQSIRAELLSV